MAKERVMERETPGNDEQSVGEQATAWIVRQDRGLDADEMVAFQRWMAGDASHARAYEHRLRAWKSFDVLAARRSTDPTVSGSAKRYWFPRQGTTLAWGAAAALVVLGMVALRRDVRNHPGATPPAPSLAALVASDRRYLSDGSVVDLAPDALLEVDYSPGERRVRLQRGAAHFQVAHDLTRPFVVNTVTGVEVRALGTAFDVWVEAKQVDVRVASGKVQVRSSRVLPPVGGSESEPVVVAGQRIVVPLVGPSTPLDLQTLPPGDRVEAPLPLSCRFERTPLSKVVEELNRWGELQLRVVDPEVDDLPIFGSCRVGHLEAFVRHLEATGELTVEREGSAVRFKRPR